LSRNFYALPGFLNYSIPTNLYTKPFITKKMLCKMTDAKPLLRYTLEAVSKPQIALKDKAQADEKAQHTR
jgi:hypothetical protein